MNPGLPSPEPDPRRLSLETLEEQLRTLPQPAVPDALPSKLIASIPPIATAGSLAAGVTKRWPFVAGIGATVILAFALLGIWLQHRSSNTLPEPNANHGATGTSTTEPNATVSSPAIRNYEQAVRIDPYDADAWFSLAKAQADVQRSADAISSAQKAIDVARSRNNAGFVNTIETWLRSYRAAGQQK
jgi:cytochrome c-type biogenesis protein CcmH/NrfG